MDPVTLGIMGMLSLLGIGTSAVGQSRTNAQNLEMMREQNDFNAQQAQLQRDWQEEQYLKYSSPSALVQQYKQAGINPAMVSKHGQGVVFSGSTAQAGNAVPAQNPFAGLGGLGPQIVGLIDSLKTNAKQRDVMDSEQQRNLADAEKLRSEANRNYSTIDLNYQTIDVMKKEIEDINNQISNRDKKVSAEVDYLNAQTSRLTTLTPKEIEKMEATIKELNSKIDLNSQQKAWYAAQVTLAGLHGDKITRDIFEQEVKNKWLNLYGVYPTEYDIKQVSHTFSILGAAAYTVNSPYENKASSSVIDKVNNQQIKYND